MHDPPLITEFSLGKILLCSSPGCNSSFPNMQKLMDHVRHHYKPNIYFQWGFLFFSPLSLIINPLHPSAKWTSELVSLCRCESCRTKLRSYRGLLTHLHTCSKVQGSKTKPTEPVAPAAQNPSTNPVLDQRAPQLDSLASELQETPSQTQNPETFVPPAAAQTSFASSPLTASTIPIQQGPSPAWQTAQQPAEVDLQPAPHMSQSLSVAGSAVSLDSSFTQDHQNTIGSPAPAPVTPSLGPSLSFQ